MPANYRRFVSRRRPRSVRAHGAIVGAFLRDFRWQHCQQLERAVSIACSPPMTRGQLVGDGARLAIDGIALLDELVRRGGYPDELLAYFPSLAGPDDEGFFTFGNLPPRAWLGAQPGARIAHWFDGSYGGGDSASSDAGDGMGG